MQLESRQSSVMSERMKFAFATKLTTTPNAVNVLMDGICTASWGVLPNILEM